MLSNINMDVVCQFKEVNDAENVIKETEQFGCWPTGHIFHIQVIYITGSYCHAGRINILLYYASLYICNQPTTLLSSAKTIYILSSEAQIHLEHESKICNAGM